MAQKQLLNFPQKTVINLNHGLQLCELLTAYNGANINIQDNTNWTPLHKAAYHSNVKCCKVLLKCDAYPTLENNLKETHLNTAEKQSERYSKDNTKSQQYKNNN